MVIATKSHGIVGFDVTDRGLSRRHIIGQVDTSLRRLQTNYIDLYYAHDPDPDTPLEQTLAVYDDLIRQGKIRYIGLSNHPAWQVTRALWIADDRRLQTPVAAEVKYNIIDRAAERELAPACQQLGLSLVPYAPLHGGLLADLAVLDRDVAGDQRFGAAGFTDTEVTVAREVDRLSRAWGLAPYQVSLAWLLSRPAVASAIVGPETPEELHANATAADVRLEPAQLAALTALAAEPPAFHHRGRQTVMNQVIIRGIPGTAAAGSRQSPTLGCARFSSSAQSTTADVLLSRSPATARYTLSPPPRRTVTASCRKPCATPRWVQRARGSGRAETRTPAIVHAGEAPAVREQPSSLPRAPGIDAIGRPLDALDDDGPGQTLRWSA